MAKKTSSRRSKAASRGPRTASKAPSRGSARAATTRGNAGASPVPSHLGISPSARATSIQTLNQILADLSALRAMYKHFHWRVAGARFIMLHELYDKHAEQVAELIDETAERIQMLGGEATAWPGDVAEMTNVERPSDGLSANPEEQLHALLEAHRVILEEAHEAADMADDGGDAGTNDLITSEIIPTNQLQAWFIGEHLDHRRGE